MKKQKKPTVEEVKKQREAEQKKEQEIAKKAVEEAQTNDKKPKKVEFTEKQKKLAELIKNSDVCNERSTLSDVYKSYAYGGHIVFGDAV